MRIPRLSILVHKSTHSNRACALGPEQGLFNLVLLICVVLDVSSKTVGEEGKRSHEARTPTVRVHRCVLFFGCGTSCEVRNVVFCRFVLGTEDFNRAFALGPEQGV